MNEKALKTLEYFKIIDMLKLKAISIAGKKMCQELVPINDFKNIKQALFETSEAVSIIYRKGSLPLGGITDIIPSVKRVEIGGVLSILELMHIGDFLHVVDKAINYGVYENKNGSFELIENYFSVLSKVPMLEKEINHCIENEQTISDSASKELAEIRRNIKISNAKIKDQLNNIIRSNESKNVLQDSVITIRNGRYCVPIKQEQRNNFQGMIHDQSSTGATLFIEPLAVVNLNNKIKELEQKETIEIEKILKRLSVMVFEYKDVIVSNFETLTYLDFVFAKGELSISMKASEPKFNNNGYVNIKKGRHPLLTGNVVPIDIYLGKDFTTLLITGPNTGGKTVSLKTLGLFILMGQSGLHISAFDNSELCIFDEVFADIGDEQSIEQSLSTFSSHMTNIVRILDQITNNSLVLLDELGAGTDPTEGAALAISILQFLHKKNVRCAVTTHYSELKVYALQTEGVVNAACEFDVETLKPTYKLLIGIPGKSNAFAISRRLGLPDDIIDGAKEFISHENAKFEDVIADLEISKKTVEIEMEKAEMFRLETEKLKKEFESKKEKLEQQKEKIILQAKENALKIIEEAKELTDTMVKQMQKDINKGTTLKNLDSIRNKLKQNGSDLAEEINKSKDFRKNIKPILKKLELGDKVYVHSFKQSGEVISELDNNGDLMVQTGLLKMKVNIKDLSLDENKEIETKKTNFYASAKKEKSKFIKAEIDLRGNLVDEALEKVDKYIDDAYLAGLSQITIIHGKGTGALRQAIKVFLGYNSHVKSFRLGSFNEGESGVTIVELK